MMGEKRAVAGAGSGCSELPDADSSESVSGLDFRSGEA